MTVIKTKYFALLDDSGAPRNVIASRGGADLRRLDRNNEWVQDSNLMSYFMGTAVGDIKPVTKAEAERLAKQLGAAGLP